MFVVACHRGSGFSQTQSQAPTDGYVGAKACESCHRQVHDTWTAGRHSKMIQAATPAAVKGDFSKSGATLQGRRYGFRAADGQYFITESELTGKPQEHRVEFTLGSRRVQHYLTTIDKGRIIVLAPSWDVQRGQWFHNVEIIRPDEDDRQVVQQWNKSCVGCHVSRQDNAYDPSTRAYRTDWMDFGTSCERCHGPGRAHVEARTAASIVRPTRLDANTNSMVCGQCHSLRTAINPEYKAGDDYYDYFVPTLEYAPYVRPHASQDPPYWADGRPRRFSNDAIGLWESACFLRGGATCTTCHTNPHLPDVDKNPQLTTVSSNALCTKCHQEIGARVAAHHAAQGRQRGQRLRRVPHAENGRQHQIDDARPHDWRAGAGKHRALQHPERVHRVSPRQARVVGRRHVEDLVALRLRSGRASEQASAPGGAGRSVFGGT
jgi:predicted CXXCH cytochrome family protein